MPADVLTSRAGWGLMVPPGTVGLAAGAAGLLPVCLTAVALVLAGAASAGAQTGDDGWQIGSFPSFSSGRYGGETSTEVLHTPITARRLFADGDVTLILPHTCVWGDGGVTVVNGIPVRTERLERAGTDGTRTERLGEEGALAGSPRTSSCGLGDVIVRGRYYVVDGGRVPTVALRAHVKTPTASADRGLGTGQFDEGVGVEVSQGLGRGTLLMADGGYTVIGDPHGFELDDNWWYDLGVGQDLAGGVVNVSVFYEWYRALAPGLEDARDVLAALTVRGRGWQVQVAALAGLSDGAPDHGVTFGASRRF